ncbi:hypothetical protein EniyanLRS_14 [Mycobacterium phage EniyanLRS]|uniref:DUF732 domain-containing protein n=1 Tax=Mycobacterium phage EniyanLRS TaxID=1933770 RepID=A0A2I2MPC0_9CAUD|nr:hypothetical protein EniyanLRS_14 [Mycobacterium phage EniyanLRS]
MYDGYMIKKCLIAFTVSSAIMFGLFWAIPEARAYGTFLDTLESYGFTISDDPRAEQTLSSHGIWVCNSLDLGFGELDLYMALQSQNPTWTPYEVDSFVAASIDFFCAEYAKKVGV